MDSYFPKLKCFPSFGLGLKQGTFYMSTCACHSRSIQSWTNKTPSAIEIEPREQKVYVALAVYNNSAHAHVFIVDVIADITTMTDAYINSIISNLLLQLQTQLQIWHAKLLNTLNKGTVASKSLPQSCWKESKSSWYFPYPFTPIYVQKKSMFQSIYKPLL